MDTSLLKKRKRISTPDERRQMKELHKEGYSFKSIGAAMGFGYQTVYRVVGGITRCPATTKKAAPVPAKPVKAKPAGKVKTLAPATVTPELEGKIRALRIYNNSAIAEQLGITMEQVALVFPSQGMKRKKK